MTVATETKLKTILNVGCGPKNLIGKVVPADILGDVTEWKELRLDSDSDAEPDIVASATDMNKVFSNSIDAIWCSHLLEHLYYYEVPIALNEFWRVLKHEGTVVITLPDLQRIAEYIVREELEESMFESQAGPITPLDCLFGLRSATVRGNVGMEHHMGFTSKTLQQHIVNAGFVNVECRRTQWDLWARGIKA